MRINRRGLLRSLAGAGLLGLTGAREQRAQEAAGRAARGMPAPKIKDIQVIETQPAGARLTVVKILTDQDGLYGYGCATFTQRADLVRVAVERYLRPLFTGKTADRIEDIWQTAYFSSYWKNGPVLNNAISGIDEALWDIKGRQAGMPVYQLAGGKCREAVECFASVRGGETKAVIEASKEMVKRGFRYIRVGGGDGGPGGGGGAGGAAPAHASNVLHDRPLYNREASYQRTLKLLEACSGAFDTEIQWATDMHERYDPRQAVQFCKAVEKLNIFFIEDPLSPEDLAYFRQIRQQCTTPIAMGELFNSPHEWQPLIHERLIDYIRCHVSQVGGFTPARKIALLGEDFGVKTAWHAPGDLSPVGHMANVTLDIVSYNFGIQEWSPFNPRVLEVFHGCAEMKDPYLWVSEKPGWGIEVDEKAAAKFPFTDAGPRSGLNGGWGDLRLADGTVIKQ
jgi:mannonate dehydratase